MDMHSLPHPGEIIRDLCLEPLGLSVTDAAKALGVSRKTLSSILNGRAGSSPEMALRLSKAFNTSLESWLNQQVQYDLWHAKKHVKTSRSKNYMPHNKAHADGRSARYASCAPLMRSVRRYRMISQSPLKRPKQSLNP